MRYDGEHKATTRGRVLSEAAKDIRAKGPHGVAVAGIMKRAGLTHGGFYAHFTSKDDLVAQAIGVMFDEARGRFDEQMAVTDPRAALDAYVGFYLSVRHRDAREAGCPLAALASDMGRLEPASRTRFGKGVAGLTDRLAGALQRIGVEQPEAAASAMLSEMVGALSLSRSVEDVAQSDAILANSAAAIRHRYGLGYESGVKN